MCYFVNENIIKINNFSNFDLKKQVWEIKTKNGVRYAVSFHLFVHIGKVQF